MRRVLESSRWSIRTSESRLSVISHTAPRINSSRFASSYAEPPRNLSRERTTVNRNDYTFRPPPRGSPVVLIDVSSKPSPGFRWNGRPATYNDRPNQNNNRVPNIQGEPSRFFKRPQTQNDQNPRPTSNWREQPRRSPSSNLPSPSSVAQTDRPPHFDKLTTPTPKIKPDFRRDDTRRNSRQLNERTSKPAQRLFGNNIGKAANVASTGLKKAEKDVKSVRTQRVKRIQARRDLYIPSVISVANFAKLLGVRHEMLQKTMRRAGMGDLSSYDHMLMTEDTSLLAMEFGYNPVVDDEAGFDIFPSPAHPQPSTLPERPPIVTIMGHVDHGKTTLLDKLRSSSVAQGEAGGITQHIGAFSVPVEVSNSGGKAKQFITFLDTPGHAAFSAMRARGARVTDIVVLVVAADDGVKPQTQEVINLIKQDQKLGVVVAITKCDKEGIKTDHVQRQLLGEGLELETFGGEIPCVEVSGLTGNGLDELVETLSAQAEIMELRAEAEGKVHGYIIESKVQKGLGPVATVLVTRGALHTQSHIISGLTSARVRQMTDASGKVVKVASPGMAVNVAGWKEVPDSGDDVLQGDESEIKKAIANRQKREVHKSLLNDAEAINEHRQEERQKKIEAERDADYFAKTGLHLGSTKKKGDEVKELRLVIKCDVSGSVEAVTGALEGIGNHLAKVKVLSSGVGEISETDVSLARAADGAIIAFNVKTPKTIESEATMHDVPIISSPIIYRLMEDVKERVIELLPIVREAQVTGEATVMQLFDINVKSRITKKIAGCRGRNGSLHRSQHIRVMRQGQCVHEGPVETLKHHKNDIQEVSREMDFGLSLQKFDDIRAGDLLQSIKFIELPRKL